MLLIVCSARGFKYTVNYTNGEISCKDGNNGQAAQTNPQGSAEAKRIRDEMVEDALGAIDGLYVQFIDDLDAGRSTTNFIADIVDLGMGAAIGISNGERALQVLGVALTAFRGGRKSLDLDYFKEQTTPILISKMNDNRSKQYAVILILLCQIKTDCKKEQKSVINKGYEITS